MSQPHICVCVVTYNQQAFIETCLRSILDQQVEADVRVLVGDDASTDDTGDIVQALTAEYGERLLYLRRQPNLGAFANMRDLLLRAKGDYVARVDGDDYWLPGKLARQLAYLEAHPTCSAVYTNAITVDEAGSKIGLFNDLGDVRLDLATLLRRGNVLNNSSVLFRAANTTGWINGDQIDYQVHLWQARHGWLGHIGRPLAAYRVNTQGSLVLSANKYVRELYWQAIQSVPRELVSDDDYANGIADFLRQVCFRAVRTRDLALLRHWVRIVYAASPYGRLRTTALSLAKILRMAAKLSVLRLTALIGRKQPPFLYLH
ncbi:Putative glycosyltransferase EpsE [Thiorhodovibrio winogradskyi]|uniref:Glycosyltransferase EpsE n=1 Tax=Thiorhodovibrio winogradskyi TaxID=77007 RepID=A0ABZ0SB98_9GAMM|nr:glycosyltransferase [Thiorhodovibrio winogradskyi]